MVEFSMQVFQTGCSYFLCAWVEHHFGWGEASRFWHQQTLMVRARNSGKKMLQQFSLKYNGFLFIDMSPHRDYYMFFKFNPFSAVVEKSWHPGTAPVSTFIDRQCKRANKPNHSSFKRRRTAIFWWRQGDSMAYILEPYLKRPLYFFLFSESSCNS